MSSSHRLGKAVASSSHKTSRNDTRILLAPSVPRDKFSGMGPRKLSQKAGSGTSPTRKPNISSMWSLRMRIWRVNFQTSGVIYSSYIWVSYFMILLSAMSVLFGNSILIGKWMPDLIMLQ